MSASDSSSSSSTLDSAADQLDDEMVAAAPLAIEIVVTSVSTWQRRVKVTIPREDIYR